MAGPFPGLAAWRNGPGKGLRKEAFRGALGQLARGSKDGDLPSDQEREDIFGLPVLANELLNPRYLVLLKVVLASLQHLFPMGFFESPVGQQGSFSFLDRLCLFRELFGRNTFHFLLEGLDEFLYLFLR